MNTQNIFFILLNKMFPLYIMIILGIISGKVLKIPKEAISKLVIYVITPYVFFYGTFTMDFQVKYLALPILFFVISTVLALSFFGIGSLIYKGNNPIKNILAMGVGTGNTGYFGFPIIFALLGAEQFSLAVFIQLGITFFESLVGFFIVARGRHSIRESLQKMCRLPLLYAAILGTICAAFDVSFGTVIDGILSDSFSYFRGSYSMLGMMMIGLGIASCSFSSVDVPFIILVLVGKSVIWPLVVIGLIFLDKLIFHIYDQDIYNVALIMSLVPLASKLVSYAVELKVFPDKVAVAVVISTLLALFYIPLILSSVFF